MHTDVHDRGYPSSERVIKCREEDKHYDMLKDKLIALGGTQIVLPENDPFLIDIVSSGQSFGGKRVSCPGDLRECHYNASRLFLKSGGQMKLCTGYALSAGGIWVQHSWGLTAPRGNRRRIIETTGEWQHYYGIILDRESAVYAACSEVSANEDLDSFLQLWPDASDLVTRVSSALRRWARRGSEYPDLPPQPPNHP